MDQGTWLDEWGSSSTLDDMAHGDAVRCKHCDLTALGQCIGSCSAHVVKKGSSEGGNQRGPGSSHQ